MTKRIFSLVLAMLILFSAVSPAYATGDNEKESITCNNSRECQAEEHREDCCAELGCEDTHLTGCLHYVAVESCALCTGTVENHAADCVSLCAVQEDCGAKTHQPECPADQIDDPDAPSDGIQPQAELPGEDESVTHAQGCKYPQEEHDSCKTACDQGCTLETDHTGDCVLPEVCAAEGCTFVVGHEGLHSNQESCATEGCEYVSGHDGLHSNQELCTTEGCEYVSGHDGLHSNQEPCTTEGCTYAAGHEGDCSNAQPEAPALSDQARAAVALLEALPSADSIPAELSDEEWEQQMAALEVAMDAYNTLGQEDMELVNAQYTQLVLNALALNDALLQVESGNYALIPYERNGKNITITLTDQFDYRANGATITVRRGNDTYEVEALGDGRYAFTKNNTNYSAQYTITVEGNDKYAQQTATVQGNQSSTSMVVEALGEYWLDFRLYYYIEQDFFPSTFGGYGDPVHYGPSGNDTPFIVLPVDVNELRDIAENSGEVVFKSSPSNNNQWEFTPPGGTSPKDDALGRTEKFWAHVLTCMSDESRNALNATGVGQVFYGYALKKQENGSLHIDGVLKAKLPVYIIEMYHNGVYFQQFYADSAVADANFRSMDDVLDVFEGRLGQTDIKWQGGTNDTYTATYEANSRRYTVTVNRINSNKNHGFATKNDVLYYSQSSDDSYYLAKFNMTVESTPLYTVTYQWRVFGPDGQLTTLPPGTYDVPNPVSGVAPDTNFTYNTGFNASTSYPDYENGLLFTFSGWTNHANVSNFSRTPDATHPAITGPTVPITGNTWINGYWTATPLEPADVHFLLRKEVVVEGGDEDYVLDHLSRVGRLFLHIETHADKDGDGKTYIDADFGQITDPDGHRVDVYQFQEPFGFTEMQTDVPGYTLTKTVTVSGAHLQLNNPDSPFDANGTAYVDMDSPSDDTKVLGTVTFTNTYTKNVGAKVDVYPSLTVYKFAGDTSEALSGITFTLTNAENANDVKTATTDEDGVLHLNGITDGTWYLKEKNVPQGYRLCEHHGENGFTIQVVPSAQTVEELRDNQYVQVNYHTLTLVGDGTCSHANLIRPLTEAAEEQNRYNLNLANEPIQGRITFTKAFDGPEEADYADVFMQLHLHGPITRNAQGGIESLGVSRIVELRKTEGWEKTIVSLPLGEYLVHEPLYDVHGYTWLGATYNGNLPGTEYNGNTYYLVNIQRQGSSTADTEITLNVVNRYEAWTDAVFTVQKVASDNSTQGLFGAQFTLYSDAACKTVVATKTTGEGGVVRFDGLSVSENDPDGVATYYLKETKAPNGYYLSQQVWQLEVKLVDTKYETKVSILEDGEWKETSAFSRQDDLLTVTDIPVLGRLNIHKEFIGELPEGISAIRVQVQGASGRDYGTYVLSEDNNWSATVTNLPMGTYTVQETEYSVPGYDLKQSSITSVDVVLEDTTGMIVSPVNPPVAEAVLRNEYQKNERYRQTYASFSVLKVDGETGQPLKDAAFTLYEGAVGDNNVVATLYTNAEGKVTFSNLRGSVDQQGRPQDGTYILVETAAPKGYAKTNREWTVTVKEDDGQYRVVLNESDNIFENFWDWIVENIVRRSGEQDDVKVLTVENNRIQYTMTVSKAFTEGGKAPTLPSDASVELLVTGPDAYSSKIVLDGVVDAVETTPWTATLSGLELGTYTVKESMASLHGHSWLGAVMEVNGAEMVNTTVERDTYVTFTVTDQTPKAGEIQLGADKTVAVAVTNNYKVWESVDFYVQKVDAEDNTILLENVTFQLYDAEGNKLQNQPFTTSATTGTSGLAHFEGFTVPEGDSVTYLLKEEMNRTDYYGCTDEWKITITKEDDRYTLDIEDTTNGTFNEAIDRLIVENRHIPATLEIKKELSGVAQGHEKDAEFTFLITGPHGYRSTVIMDGKIDTGENIVETAPWTATLTNLRMGDYTVEETSQKVPGYTLTGTTYAGSTPAAQSGDTPTSITVTLDNGAKAKLVTVTNTYTQNTNPLVNPAAFEILKVEAGKESKTLAGAVFGLFAEDEAEPAFKATTGTDGIARFDGLVGDADHPGKTITYTLKEITAPQGYLKTDQTWSVEVTEKDGEVTVELHPENNHYDSIWDWVVDVFRPDEDTVLENGTLKIENTPTKLTLNKEEQWYLDGKRVSLAEIEDLAGELPDRTYTFQIEWQLEGATYNVNREITLTGESGGSAVVEGLIPEGASYKVTELTGGSTDFIVDYGVGCEGTIGDASTATVTNSYYYNQVDPLNEDDELTDQDSGMLSVELKLIKKDVGAAQALGGAKFELRDSNGQKKAEAISDGNGLLHFVISSPGNYQLVETQAPAGYSRLNSAIAIRVEEGTPYTTQEIIDNATVTVTHIPLQIAGAGGLTLENGRYVVNNEPTITLTVNKAWVDGGYYKRPSSIQVKLLRDGLEAQGYDPITLNSTNDWTAAWTGLDANADWSVEEVAVGDGYVASYSERTVDNKITITNTRTPVPVDITVQKFWRGAAVDEVTVRLYGNGVLLESVILNSAKGWEHTWEDLPDTMVYTVDEVRISGYYKRVTHDDSGQNWVITNTLSLLPQTGDNVELAIGTMLLSAAALVMLLVLGRDKRRGKFTT